MTSEGTTVRLVLEPAELTVLRASLPRGLRVNDAAVDVDEQARSALRARGVIGADGTVHRSVLAGLALLADPAAVHLSVVAAGPAMVRRSSVALSEHLLTGLTVEEPSGRAEHVMARTGAAADELVRLLPDLGLPGPDGRSGLRDVEPGELMAAVDRGLVGSMSVTLSVPAGVIAEVPVLDRVLWVATSGGWWALRPHSDSEGVPLLDVLPVAPDGFAHDLAPLMAAVALALAARR